MLNGLEEFVIEFELNRIHLTLSSWTGLHFNDFNDKQQ